MSDIEDKNDVLEGEEGLDQSNDRELVDENSESESYPVKIRIDRSQYSILHLKNLVVNRKQLIIDPEFQRGGKGVWQPRQRCELIESILMGIPIPIMYLFESKDGKRQVVDGRQRISTIIDYLSNGFPLKDLRILKGEQYKNCYFKDLSPMDQGLIEDYQLLFYIIQPPTPERVKYDIFDRVNRGGTRLNNQEMRNALYQGKATKLLRDLALSTPFLEATENGISPDRMKDRYVILRLLSFFMLNNGWYQANGGDVVYKSDLEDFLAKSMSFINNNLPEAKIDRLKQLFFQAMNCINNTIGHDAFRFRPKETDNNCSRRPINMLLFEALGYIFMTAAEKKWDLSSVNFEIVKKQFDESTFFDGKNDSKKRVEERYNFILDCLKDYDYECLHK